MNLSYGLSWLTFLPLIGGGETKFQPVYVGDVASAIVKALSGAAKPGATYELGGPETASFKALLEYILAVTNRKRILAPLPFGLAKVQASFLELLLPAGRLLGLDLGEHLREAGLVRRDLVRGALQVRLLLLQLFDGAQRPTAFVLYGSKKQEQEQAPYRFEYWVPKADLNL